MTDWNQIDALADLESVRQRRLIANAQAKRDASLAAQNAEVIALLREQKEREEKETQRLAALPKCPDCRGPVEIGARRCPQCRIEVISYKFVTMPYSMPFICRAGDIESTLQQRCDAIGHDAAAIKSECLSIVNVCDETWRRNACDALLDLRATVSRYKTESQAIVLHLFGKARTGERMLPPKEEAALNDKRRQIDVAYPETTIQRLQAEANQRRRALGWLPVLGGCGGALWALVALCHVVFSIGEVLPEVFAQIGFGLLIAALGYGLWMYVEKRRVHQERVAGLALQQLAEVSAARESSLKACEEKSAALDAAWRKKLNEDGLLKKLTLSDMYVDVPRQASELSFAPLQGLRAALLALAETLDFATELNLSVNSQLGRDTAQIRNLAQNSLVVPQMHHLPDKTSINDVEDIEGTYRSFHAVRSALESLTL